MCFFTVQLHRCSLQQNSTYILSKQQSKKGRDALIAAKLEFDIDTDEIGIYHLRYTYIRDDRDVLFASVEHDCKGVSDQK